MLGEQSPHRLAQRPGADAVLKYVRPVIKRLDTRAIRCAPAPVGVLEGSRADVSLVAGILLDKAAYHLPLYRQRQRMSDAGIHVTRPWLTPLFHQGAGLLRPIHDAPFASIRSSRVQAMDETPIKAGRQGPGKMKAACFWPAYGEHDEGCFPFFESRAHGHVEQALGLTRGKGAVLLGDGYGAYSACARKVGLTPASCRAHARREVLEAQNIEPQVAAEALARIVALYAVEEPIRENKLAGESKHLYRLMHGQPIVERFFTWIDEQLDGRGLLPSHPMTQALRYARQRRVSPEVFLTDPDVAIDTHHLERALRAIPTGRKAWMFCWTEVGAQHLGVLQSLIVTCRLHGIDPYTCLVDVLQRVSVSIPPHESPSSRHDRGNRTSPRIPCAPICTGSACKQGRRLVTGYRWAAFFCGAPAIPLRGARQSAGLKAAERKTKNPAERGLSCNGPRRRC